MKYCWQVSCPATERRTTSSLISNILGLYPKNLCHFCRHTVNWRKAISFKSFYFQWVWIWSLYDRWFYCSKFSGHLCGHLDLSSVTKSQQAFLSKQNLQHGLDQFSSRSKDKPDKGSPPSGQRCSLLSLTSPSSTCKCILSTTTWHSCKQFTSFEGLRKKIEDKSGENILPLL